MTNSEIKEIRKRIEPTLGNFKCIYGCYVNAASEIVSTMRIPVADMHQGEKEQYAALIKKAISGTKGRNLLDLSFSSAQVEKSDEHRLLMALRESHLEDEAMRTALYEQIVNSLATDGKGYVILLSADTYDVESRGGDDDGWSEESETQFEYFICSICQVKEPKAALRYLAEPKAFRGTSTGSILASPFLGFMFPAFDDRQANIYDVLYYTKSTKDMHEELIEDLFRMDRYPLTAEMQKTTFNETLAQTLTDDCSMEVITSLQSRIASKLEGSEGENAVNVPEVTLDEVCGILKDKGVPAKKADEFRELAETRLGDTSVKAANLLQKNDYQITSSESKITVAPEQAVRIRTKVIDGVTYFLVPVGSDVKVNGVDISVGYGKE